MKRKSHRVGDARVPYLVPIAFTDRMPYGIEQGDRFFGMANDDGSREESIDRRDQSLGGSPPMLQRDRYDLCRRMHASVGSTTTADLNLLARGLLDRLRQSLLNGGSIVLNLPPSEPRSIVRHRQSKPSHSKKKVVAEEQRMETVGTGGIGRGCGRR